MKLRQAKKIARRMRWRSMINPSDSERRARRIVLKRLPFWKLVARAGSELDSAAGRRWLREISRSKAARQMGAAALKAQKDLILYGSTSMPPMEPMGTGILESMQEARAAIERSFSLPPISPKLWISPKIELPMPDEYYGVARYYPLKP